ncbi:MAG: PASTA domain-containing protein, partial [Eubacteriales bacterium]|nr:PASTA domain-containing protein [Eubacteriales bacterium]
GNIRTSDGKCRIKISVNKYPDNLTVPDVKYMTASEAEKILKQYNLYAVTEYVTDVYANEKQIVNTKPEIGSFIQPGATVTLYICQGTEINEAKTMPKVVGDDVDSAKDKLENAYYLVSVVYENSDKPEGQVIAQDIPAYTTGLAPWTMVTLTVSHYTQHKTVENYFGMTLDAAAAKINAAGFIVGSVSYVDSIYTSGTVINQGVKSGTSAAAGTVINLLISGEGIDLASPVPDVLGKNVTVATQLLEQAGYSVSITGSPSSGAVDMVLKQSVAAGNTGYPVGTKITLTVSIAEDSVKTADLKGYTFTQVLKYLSEKKLTLGAVTFTTEAQDQTAEYAVVAQTIASGTYVNPGTSIGVTLYGEPCYAKAAPSTVGMTEAGAVKALNDAWYRVEVEYEYANGTDGAVLRQSIAEGVSDKVPGTKVTITVCVKKTTVTVPDLSGKTLDQAVDILINLGLELGVVSYEQSNSPSDTVINQSPAANIEVAFNTEVNVTLSDNTG